MEGLQSMGPTRMAARDVFVAFTPLSVHISTDAAPLHPRSLCMQFKDPVSGQRLTSTAVDEGTA